MNDYNLRNSKTLGSINTLSLSFPPLLLLYLSLRLHTRIIQGLTLKIQDIHVRNEIWNGPFHTIPFPFHPIPLHSIL